MTGLNGLNQENGYKIREDYISSIIDYCLDNAVEYIILDPLKRFHRLSENLMMIWIF